jgi:3-oxoacyl-[acyl-carrier-protein] synthase-3
MILPHLSSYYFEPAVKKFIKEFSQGEAVPYWTNLRTAGNTGAASIYIMLDEYLKTKPVKTGDRLLLFVPESGQFNYVLISLTVV